MVDENGFELLVTYRTTYESQVEECHGYHEKGGVEIELTSVQLAMRNLTLELLDLLSNAQRKYIIEKIDF